jgi:hypothetical protein
MILLVQYLPFLPSTTTRLTDLIVVVDQQTVQSLVPVVEPDTSITPSAEPRLERDPITVETVETELLGINDKNDLKKNIV